ncbi:MATE family efflux transporter [Chloroflexota bacterium]
MTRRKGLVPDMEKLSNSGGSSSAPGRDWTKGSVLRNLLTLSGPMIISQSLNMIGPTIDMIWVGKLGAASIAGVGVGGMVVMFITSTMMGLNMGTRAMVARFIGAGNPDGANNVARQAFIISAVFTSIMVTVGIFLSEQILTFIGVEADVVVEGASYMRIIFVGGAAMTFWMLAEGIMQASGDAVTPMRISILIRTIHIVLAPFMVLGWWIFPRLGVSGAALTNVFTQGLGLVLGMWFLFSGRTRLRLTLSNFRVDLSMIWRIVRIGIPASVTRMQRGLLHLVLMMLMVPFGTLGVAAHTIGQRLDMVVFMLIMGLGLGAGVLTGQNLGAGQPERAERGGWLALGIGEGVMIIISTVIMLWAENIISIFNAEPELVKLASSFMRIAVVTYLVASFIAIFQNVLSGAGDTIPAMIIEVGHMWLVTVPLAILLPRITGLGVYGIRWAIVAGVMVGAVAYLIYFRTGRWKRKRI